MNDYNKTFGFFSLKELIFFYAVKFTQKCGFLLAVNTEKLVIEPFYSQRKEKIHSIFFMRYGEKTYHLSKRIRLVVVDDNYFFYSMDSYDWFEFKIDGSEFEKQEILDELVALNFLVMV